MAWTGGLNRIVHPGKIGMDVPGSKCEWQEKESIALVQYCLRIEEVTSHERLMVTEIKREASGSGTR